ncbi:MAG: trypsin-like serine peptidase [Nitrososphaeraceae archaeon]
MATINTRINDTTKRYQHRSKIRSKTLGVLSTNDPDSIIKIDDPKRVQVRKKLLKRNHNLTLERILGGNDLMPIHSLDIAKRTSKSVCRIRIRNQNGHTLGYGTGFMVSPSLLMTNNHVLENIDICKKSLAEFDYQLDEELNPKPVETFKLQPDKFFYTNRNLDFTLVYVSPTSLTNKPLSDFGHLKLIKESGKAVIGEYVSIIQHPSGEMKSITMRENRVVDIFDDFVHSLADTERGSSGSPVHNDQWEVVSLHHSGVPKLDEQGNVLSVDGTLWKKGMGDDKIAWIANESVRVSSIIKDLQNVASSSDLDTQLLNAVIG